MIKKRSASKDMGSCSKCGKQAMTFTCRYCGEKFCTEHRLPENHDCGELEEELESEDKWFREEEKQEESTTTPDRREPEVRPPSLLSDLARSLRRNYTLMIIAVTVASFLLQYSVPGYSGLMALDPSLDSILGAPWTLLTVMLVHGGTFHIFANMVTFYFFGTPVERLAGGKELLKFYIASGLAASIGYVLFRNLLFQLYGPSLNGAPTLGLAVGASGAVVATFAAVSIIYPDAEVLLYFFIPMKIKTALYLFGGLEAFNIAAKLAGYTLPVIGNFASSAHLTGLIVGLWYGRKLRQKASRTSVLDLLGY